MRKLSSLILLHIVACGARAEITVGAAISLSDAVMEISTAYEKETGSRIRHTFAGTNVISRQIESGAPIDIFLSADGAHMDALVAKGLMEKDTVRTTATNHLVVIVPANSKLSLASPVDLLSVDRIAIADPTAVPAGIYAKKWLEAENLWGKIQPRTIPLLNVRAALVAAETSNVDAAIVYRSDAVSSRKIKTAFAANPVKNSSIEYPAGIVSASRNKAEAGAYLAFFANRQSRETLARRGFSFPDPP